MIEQAVAAGRQASADEVLIELMELMTERVQTGETVDVEAYVRKYPQYAEQLRRMSLTLDVLKDLAGASTGEVKAAGAHQSPTSGSPTTTGMLGDYRILGELGRGGMGVVYEAQQVSLGRKVALKVLPYAAMLDHKQLQRFQNEARAAASLRHPNIVQVHFVGCERAVHFYAMDYIEGQTLAELVRHLRQTEGLEGEAREEKGESPDRPDFPGPKAVSDLADSLASGRFAPAKAASDPNALTDAYTPAPTPGALAETLRAPHAAISTERSTKGPAYFRSIAQIGAQVAEALDHAHQNGVIHRDVKPSNVILDNAGKPWVTDFGLARIEADATLTVSGDLLGTVRYMSPEQALAKRIVVDHRTDVYSLGATLYELMTLQPVFNGQDRQELLRQIAFEEPVAPRTLNRAIPAELETIVLKSMAKNPAERYDTAQDLADDLKRFLDDLPIRARRPTLIHRAAKWSRRHKPIVWSAAVSTLLLLVVGLVGLGIGNMMIRQQRDAKDAALVAERNALEEKQRALSSAEANLRTAETERRRAEGNLDLALKALDAVYLDAIGTEKLLGPPRAKPGAEGFAPLAPPPMTAMEKDLLKRGLTFYDQFAQQNAVAPRAAVQTAQAHYRVGLIHAGLGDGTRAAEAYREAIWRFDRLTKEEPKNAEHFRQLADAYRALANAVPDWDAAKKTLEDSRRAYSRAIELRPGDATLYLDRGHVVYVLSGSRDMGDYERALQLDPDNVAALLTCCEHYHSGHDSVQDFRKARECGERAVALAPNNPQCHIALARVLGQVFQGEPGPRVNAAAALKHFERAIQLAPNSAEAHRSRGQFYYYVADNDRALVDLNRALELDPHDYRAMHSRARVFRQLGQYDKALAELAIVAKFIPHKAPLHNDIGSIHLRRGNWQAALEAFTKALEIAPFTYHVLGRRALAYVHMGRYEQALADLRKGLEVTPGHRPWQTVMLLWIPKAQLEGAPETFRQGLLELAREAIERSPVPADAYAVRARLYERMNDLEKAEAEFSKAIDLRKGEVLPWTNRAAWYLERTEWAKAAADYAKAVDLDQNNVMIRYWCAVTRLGANDVAGYRKACADLVGQFAKTEDPMAANFTAWTAALAPGAVEDYAPHVALANKAVAAKPDDPQFLNTLGAILYRAGRHQEAVNRLTELDRRLKEPGRSAQSSPAYTLYFLALAHHKLGQPDKAKQYLAKANASAEQELANNSEPPPWNRRLTLQWLRTEAEALIAPPKPAAPPAAKAAPNEKPKEKDAKK